MASGWSVGVKRVGKVKPVRSGIIGIAKGGGVRGLLQSQADAAASRCNSIAGTVHSRTAPLYASEIKVLDNTAAGRVYAANVEAHVDNRLRNTLKKGCGA